VAVLSVCDMPGEVDLAPGGRKLIEDAADGTASLGRGGQACGQGGGDHADRPPRPSSSPEAAANAFVAWLGQKAEEGAEAGILDDPAKAFWAFARKSGLVLPESDFEEMESRAIPGSETQGEMALGMAPWPPGRFSFGSFGESLTRPPDALDFEHHELRGRLAETLSRGTIDYGASLTGLRHKTQSPEENAFERFTGVSVVYFRGEADRPGSEE